jgi:hypothetical protein
LTLKAGAEGTLCILPAGARAHACLRSSGVLAAFKAGKVDKTDAVTSVLNLAQVVRPSPLSQLPPLTHPLVQIEKNMDGTSGALYSIWSNALAAGLSLSAKSLSSTTATSAVWALALSHALKVLYTYTAARRPSRTLVDPLEAFTGIFAYSKGEDFAGAVKEAAAASEKTKDLVAKAGRAACRLSLLLLSVSASTLLISLCRCRCWEGGASRSSSPGSGSARRGAAAEGNRVGAVMFGWQWQSRWFGSLGHSCDENLKEREREAEKFDVVAQPLF